MSMQIFASVRQGRILICSKQITLLQHLTAKKNHTGTKVFGAASQCQDALKSNSSKDLHLSVQKSYPAAKPIPLPDNVDDIDDSQLACFSPQRDRDISGSVILSKADRSFDLGSRKCFNQQSYPADPHVASYDCQGALSLSSSMQTNVPEPFSSNGKSTHLNMPGGQWGRDHKYIAEDMQRTRTHYPVQREDSQWVHQGTSTRPAVNWNNGAYLQLRQYSTLTNNNRLMLANGDEHWRYYCTPVKDDKPVVEISRKDKLKQAIKEYGSTVIVFHVAISLVSLGGCYLAVTSGLELGGALKTLGSGSEVAAEAGQFVVAYAIHKVFAPVRISITLVSTPFIVRYLRKINVLKPPKSVVD